MWRDWVWCLGSSYWHLFNGPCTELAVSQRQCDADQQRLWSDLSAHITSVHSCHTNAAAVTLAAANSPVLHDQRSQHPTGGQMSTVHTVGLSSASQPCPSYTGPQSSLADVCSTVNKAGRCCCFISLLCTEDIFVSVLRTSSWQVSDIDWLYCNFKTSY